MQRSDTGLRTLITVATYNEIENLPNLVDAIFESSPSVHLLIVDDNSPDGTGVWAQQRSRTDERVRSIVRSGKLGLGSAILLAIQHAIAAGDYQYLLNLDGDFSHDPQRIPALLEAMDAGRGRDVVIGSRYVAGGAIVGWPRLRRWMSRTVNTYARFWLRLPVRDCSGGFRCFRVGLLARIDLDAVRSTGYSFHEELLWRLKRVGARFGETPIIFHDRRYGRSKINLREAFNAVWILFRLGLTERFGRRS